MATDSPVHPLKLWRVKRGYDYETVARLVAALGQEISPRYVEAIERAYRHPSWELAEAFQKLTDGETTVAELKRFPLKGSTH